ncbi:MAG: DNA polymerase I [Clostridia bacterium]|nr:DNA polymerase I [Clostridia bacterium]
MKLLAIDGNSIINRAFYGIKLLSTKDGQYTNAIYGFINILNKLLEKENPDCVAVAFDLKAPTFRHKMYDAYKAGRHATPYELLCQFPVLKQWLTLAGYHYIECEGYEADDILGTLAHSASNGGDSCVIATGDRDSLQLVSDSTRVLLTVTKMGHPEITDYTPEKLFEDYGLTPAEMIELKSLMGDSSDNIPGVMGVGQKTATDLITKYHSIDYIYEHLDELDIKSGVKLKLQNDKDNAFLSRTLGTISVDAPINTAIDSYKISPADTGALSRLMTRLEFFKLMQKMGITPSANTEQVVKNADTTTFKIGEASCIKGNADIYIDQNGICAVSDNTVCKLSQTQLTQILNNDKIEKRVYDYKNLYKKYTDIKSVKFDAMLAGYLCNPSASDYSIDRLVAEYGVANPAVDNCNDPLVLSAVQFTTCCDGLTKSLQNSGQLDLLYTIEVPLARVLAEMELEGFLADFDGLQSYGKELEIRIDEFTNEIYNLAGEKFNINSPKQLGQILFVKLGLPAKKKTKSGFSTSADVLEELRYDYPIVDMILKYRQLAKLKSAYCDGLMNARGDDGRIHSTFNQTEARTGRISSLEPNLQNIPVRTEEGKILRKFFTAREGCVLCDADYSQIELRVLASMAKDDTMIDAFRSGTDIHTVTASQVFNIPIDMVLPIMRSRAKAVNFGIVYGIGAFSLAKDIGVTRKEADTYIKNYLATYKGIADYMQNTIAEAKQNGYVSTLFGRRRYLPELSASNGMLRAFGERVARNAPIQGTAADIIKIAMIKVSDRLKAEIPSARLILQVHDELIVECEEKDRDTVCKILEQEMQNAASLSVELKVDAHSGKTWLEAKD